MCTSLLKDNLQVPFPSVTICPQIKSKATVYNYTSEIAKFQEILNITDKNILEM